MDADAEYADQDSLIIAQQEFRELCLKFSEDGNTAQKKKNLFASGEETKKVKLRPSMIDRACVKSKVFTSTPMILSRNQPFAPNNTSLVSSIEETCSNASLSGIENVSEHGNNPNAGGNLSSVGDRAPPQGTSARGNKSTLDDNNSVIVISSMENDAVNTTHNRSELRRSVMSKKSNVESIVNALVDVTSRGVQTSFKNTSFSLKKIARGPTKYDAKETQTGASLLKRKTQFFIRPSDSSHSTSLSSLAVPILKRWEEGDILPKMPIFDMTPWRDQVDGAHVSTSRRDMGLPWRASSTLDAHLVQTPENAIQPRDWDEAEESLDETFLPKGRKFKKVFVNKKKFVKNDRKSNARRSGRTSTTTRKSEARATERDNETSNNVKNCTLSRTQSRDLLKVSRAAASKVKSRGQLPETIETLPQNDICTALRSQNREESLPHSPKRNATSSCGYKNIAGKDVSDALNNGKPGLLTNTEMLDSSTIAKKLNIIFRKILNNKNVTSAIRAECDDSHAKKQDELAVGRARSCNTKLQKEQTSPPPNRPVGSKTKARETENRNSRAHKSIREKSAINREFEDLSNCSLNRKRNDSVWVCTDAVNSLDFNRNTSVTREQEDPSNMKMNIMNSAGIPQDLFQEFQDLAADLRTDSQLAEPKKLQAKKNIKTGNKRKTNKASTSEINVSRTMQTRNMTRQGLQSQDSQLEISPSTTRELPDWTTDSQVSNQQAEIKKSQYRKRPTGNRTQTSEINVTRTKRTRNRTTQELDPEEPEPGTSRSPTKLVSINKNLSTQDLQDTTDLVSEGGRRRSGRERKPITRRIDVGFIALHSKSVKSAVDVSAKVSGVLQTRRSSKSKASNIYRSKCTASSVCSLLPINEVEEDLVDRIIEKKTGFAALKMANAAMEREEVQITSPIKSKKPSGTKKNTSVPANVGKKTSRARSTRKNLRDALSMTLNHNNTQEIDNTLNVRNGIVLKSTKWAYKDLKFESVEDMPGVSWTMADGGPGGMRILKLDPEAVKPEQTAVSQSIEFCVMSGQAFVELQDQNAKLKTLEMFIVPKGQVYSLKNTSKKKALFLSFTRSG